MILQWVLIVLVLASTSFGLILTARNYFRWRLQAKPAAWRELIELSQGSKAPLPGSVRTPTIRRELILRSKKPNLFSNYYEMSSLHGVKLSDEIPAGRRIVGFLHPHANAGGGGERVLWAAVRATLRSEPEAVVVIYTAAQKDVTPNKLTANAAAKFGIQFSESEHARIVIILLSQTRLIEAATYPLFTLLGQAAGSAILAYEAISNLMPDCLVDTTGIAFSYPVVAQLAGIPIVAYVHYPFVQSDMLASLKIWSPKQIYWRVLQLAYRWAGSYATAVAVNSSWTLNHMKAIWPQTNGRACEILYPPSDVTSFGEPPATEIRSEAMVYLAQFRPEKRHEIVLRAFARVLAAPASTFGKSKPKPSLIFIGSIRNEEDQKRADSLQKLADELKLGDKFVLVPNAPWEAVQRILKSSLVGVNAMWNEHFGMGVVETMAAGLIPVVHASAGPLNDIVKDDEGHPGFFFKSKRDPDNLATEKDPRLSDAMISALKLSQDERAAMRHRAWAASQKFSDENFDAGFVALLSKIDKKTQ